ncbi:unnamed protein product, partial [Iphiclides podalirius]
MAFFISSIAIADQPRPDPGTVARPPLQQGKRGPATGGRAAPRTRDADLWKQFVECDPDHRHPPAGEL